ncbi:MAG: hypothetical protein LUE64_04350 [Candidatus Gastranaerophilales bacterium]|nr:hypothetical protein [Candidatus Gastranaerophilales bacterium]
MADTRIEINPELTGIALAFKNKNCIADKVFDKVKVNTQSFKYRTYPKSSFLSLPETLIGEMGEPNRLDLQGKLLTESVQDHALEAVLPVSVKEANQRAYDGVDVASLKTMQLTSALLARKEVALSKILSTASNYGDNTKTLSDDEKISNTSVNAFDLIIDAMDEIFFKPNKMVLSRKAFSQLRRNPYIVKAIHKNDGDVGAATLNELKEIFELDEILVGESVVDTSKNKKAPVLEACWANDIILMYTDPLALTDSGITFGYSAEYDPITIGTYFEGRTGKQGADILKAYMSYINLITCPECGYLIKDVI